MLIHPSIHLCFSGAHFSSSASPWPRLSLCHVVMVSHVGAWRYLERAMGWCKEVGLEMIIDLHGAPGISEGTIKCHP